MNLSLYRPITLAFLLCLPVCLLSQDLPPLPDNLNNPVLVTVERVKDGDTFVIYPEMGQSETVRLNGIDSPELKQPFGQQTKHTVEKLIDQKYIWIERLCEDNFGRTMPHGKMPSAHLLQQMY